jgi:hypothetical protein
VLEAQSDHELSSPHLIALSLNGHSMLTDENPTRPASPPSYSRAANEMNDGETILLTRSAL